MFENLMFIWICLNTLMIAGRISFVILWICSKVFRDEVKQELSNKE